VRDQGAALVYQDLLFDEELPARFFPLFSPQIFVVETHALGFQVESGIRGPLPRTEQALRKNV
jgi:hypothetical protein